MEAGYREKNLKVMDLESNQNWSQFVDFTLT